MKNIIVLTTALLVTTSTINAEEKKTLSDTFGKGGGCISEHKITPTAFGCSVKKLFKNLAFLVILAFLVKKKG